MKKISLLILLFVTVLFTACEKDKENVILNDTIAANTLSNFTGGPFVLLMDNAALKFQDFSWTAVDYGFTAATTYTLQMDVQGNDFAAAIDVLTTDTLTSTITVGDLNKFLLDAGFDPEVALNLQFRVKAVIHPDVPVVYSNTVLAVVTPYATSFPPIYMCGAAVGGWNWNQYTYKELRSSAPGVYETVAYFNNTGTDSYFRFFKQADWGPTDYRFAYFTGTVSALFEGQSDGDNNFRFIGTSGYYHITVNMKTKSVAMEAVPDQVMFMTGSGVGNGAWDWNPGDYVAMTWLSNGIYRATCNFNNGGAFRFFAQQGWGPTSYNYPWFDGGSVTTLLINANDGDKNFGVSAATGTYTITVNLLDKIVTMVILAP